ncbi:MAG TPA: hypothetical protein VGW76_18895 [Pyrinomonadaceae bacterium]|nr:hypothetical protein [Pyrinomonadaceae bacterium]
MKFLSLRSLILIGPLLLFPALVAAQQKNTSAPKAQPQLVRTTSRHEVRRFGYGGTVTLVGAPNGSIIIEGWARNEVDISAEIELRADTEANLSLLAAVNNVVIDDDVNHIQVLSTGTHDKVFMRSAAKKFPKALLGLPWKIDYRIRVPVMTDLEVNAGQGPITIGGVEGNVRITAAESLTNLKMTGGVLSAIIAVGKVNLEVPARSWARGSAEIRLAAGDIVVNIPAGFSGDFDAEVLRAGKIENSYEGLLPRERQSPTPNKVNLRAGAGGASFHLTVGDGTIAIRKQ